MQSARPTPPTADPRVRMVIGISRFGAVACLGFAVVSGLGLEEGAPVVAFLVVLAAIMASLGYHARRTGDTRLPAHVLAFLLISSALVTSVIRGGFVPTAFLRTALVPIIVVYLAGSLASIGWTAVAVLELVLVLCGAWAGLYPEMPGYVSEAAQDLSDALSVGFLLTFAGWLTVQIERGRTEMEAQRQAAEARAEAASRLQRVGMVAAGVAHNFNNLITVILNSTSLARAGVNSPSRVSAELDAISTAAGQGAALAHRLLFLGRPEGGEPVLVDLAHRVRGARTLLQSALPAGIQLTLSVPEAACFVRLDPAGFDQALLNLVVNARDAVGASGKLSVEVTTDGEVVRVSVSDDGPGMDETVLARIFEPFFSTKSPEEGSGLGLATAQAFARAADGDIDVWSTPGEGSCLTLVFPHQAAPEGRARELTPGPASGQLLLVDDDPLVRRALGRGLKAVGHQVTVAAGGEEALETLASGADFDLVITDLNMPGIDGLTLIGELANRSPSLPVLILTARAGGVPPTSAQVHRVIHKPIGLDELNEHILAALSEKA